MSGRLLPFTTEPFHQTTTVFGDPVVPKLLVYQVS
jgi:hypothetical protein